MNKKLQKLKDVGIDYDFIPVDVPEKIKDKTAPSEEVGKTFKADPLDSAIEVNVSKKRRSDIHEYEQDPFDSDIEIKIPVKRKFETCRKSTKNVILNQSPSMDNKTIISNKLKSGTLNQTPKKRTSKQIPKITPKKTHNQKLVSRKST